MNESEGDSTGSPQPWWVLLVLFVATGVLIGLAFWYQTSGAHDRDTKARCIVC